jgi:hypothetical protein
MRSVSIYETILAIERIAAGSMASVGYAQELVYGSVAIVGERMAAGYHVSIRFTRCERM